MKKKKSYKSKDIMTPLEKLSFSKMVTTISPIWHARLTMNVLCLSFHWEVESVSRQTVTVTLCDFLG